MSQTEKKEPFKNLSFKASVATKFIKFSKAISKSRSATLLLMLEFFEYNNISPSESLGPRMQTLESTITKRINALVAIIRDIEINQTLPTKGMLDALFEGMPGPSTKKLSTSFEKAFENLTVQRPPEQHHPNNTDHHDIRKVLIRMELVKPPFGKPYWKVSLTNSEIAHLKNKYHVYNN
ncbi:hypothetical protein E0K83_12325 [Gramella sp. BOM4]|nr:hypothetical protein [Christiangramia bathymodioli]